MPPRHPGWDRRRSSDACIRWAVTLVEPLLPLRRVVLLDARLVEALAADPDFVALWFAGVTSDVVRTLPGDDGWRSVALPPPERSPGQASQQPPARTAQEPSDGPGASPGVQMDPRTLSEAPGAAEHPAPGAGLAPHWPSGRPFGTWRDGTDLVELAWGSPERDPGLVPLADDLAPGAARLLVAGFAGWRSAWAEAERLVEATVEATGEALPALADLVDALRWACWRRRAYGFAPSEDTWPYESAHHWATRAFELLELGKDPNEAVIERDARWHRIAEREA